MFLLAGCAAVLLGACAEQSNVRVTSRTPQPVQTKSRSEPVFFNGHHYQVDYTFNESADAFDVRVKGTSRAMKAADRKSAVEIATSAVRHFACPKGMTGALTGDPNFSGGTWAMRARCA